MPWPAAAPLDTARLRLEPLTVAAAGEMVAVLADPGLYAFTGGGPPSLADLRRRYATQVAGGSADGAQGWLNWVVRRGRPGEALGFVQATVERDDDGLVAEVAWVLGRGQGQGLAAEAARAVLGWLTDQGVGRFVAHVHPAHAASSGVARSCGLLPTDQVRDGEVRWEGRPR